MEDPTRREVFAHISPKAIDYIDRDAAPTDVDVSDRPLDSLWQSWVTLTFELMTFGATHRTICDAAGELAPVVLEHNERQAATKP